MRYWLLLALGCSLLKPAKSQDETRLCSAATDLSAKHLYDYLYATFPPYKSASSATQLAAYTPDRCMKYWYHTNKPSSDTFYPIWTLFWDQVRYDACHNDACHPSAGHDGDMGSCRTNAQTDVDMCRMVLANQEDRKQYRNYIFYNGMHGISGAAAPYSNDTVTYAISINLGASQSHSYFPTDGGRNTLWTQLQLVPPSPNPNSFFKLESVLFDAPITFDKSTIHNTGITYSADVAKRVQKRGSQYGIYTRGCSPPVLTLTVTFVSSNEKPDLTESKFYGNLDNFFTGPTYSCQNLPGFCIA